MRQFLVIGLVGNLGNQLFQYASGHGLAHNLGAELLFDTARVRGELLLPRLIGPRYKEASRPQLLRVGVDRYSRGAGKNWPDVACRLVTISRRARGREGPNITLDDLQDPGRYRSELNDLHPPVSLRGYLQSERYFSHVQDEIDASIVFPENSPRLVDSGRSTVAVSFRRGIFVRLGWSLPWTYYEAALTRVAEQVGDPELVLFGDDPTFVEDAVSRVAAYGPVVNGVEIASDPIGQLTLMTQCDHAVMANSTFAWWGSWLGDQRHRLPGRMVVAPAEFEIGGDLLPDRWIQVPAGIQIKYTRRDGSEVTLSGG